MSWVDAYLCYLMFPLNSFGHGALLDSIQSDEKQNVEKVYDKYCYNDGSTIKMKEAANGFIRKKQ